MSASQNAEPSREAKDVDRRSLRPNRFLRWSLSGCFAALILIAGYFGGRNAGFDAGRMEGRQIGEREGYERSLRALGFAEGFEHVFDVAGHLDARIGGLPPGDAAQRRVDAELQAMIDEIYVHVEPGIWTRPEADGTSRIEASGTDLTLTVHAKPSAVAAVGRWLKAEKEASERSANSVEEG